MCSLLVTPIKRKEPVKPPFLKLTCLRRYPHPLPRVPVNTCFQNTGLKEAVSFHPPPEHLWRSPFKTFDRVRPYPYPPPSSTREYPIPEHRPKGSRVLPSSPEHLWRPPFKALDCVRPYPQPLPRLLAKTPFYNSSVRFVATSWWIQLYTLWRICLIEKIKQ